MLQANTVFVTTLFLIFIGYLIKKLNIISETDGKVVSKLLMHTTFPALMFLSTSHIKLESGLFLIPFTSLTLGCVMILVAWFVFSGLPDKLRGVLLMSAGGFNSGLFGFPLVEGIWGRTGLVYVIMFDMGVTVTVFFIVYSIGVYFSQKGTGQIRFQTILKKIIRLPPLQAAILGLLFNALNFQIPEIVTDALDILAKANKALVLLLMGIYLNFSFDKTQISSIAKALLIRYAFGLTAAALFYFLIPVESLFRNIMMVCVVLPVGLTLIPFSDEFNFDTATAGALVNLSLFVSFILIWLLVIGFKMV